MNRIMVLHGPNLNMLGVREPEKYGTISLDAINDSLLTQASQHEVTLLIYQSNHEGELVEHIQQAAKANIDYIICNAAAFTHTSIALRDALLGINIPFIEIHMTNLYRREPFRQQSYLSDIARGIVSGFGANSYKLALQAAIDELKQSEQ